MKGQQVLVAWHDAGQLFDSLEPLTQRVDARIHHALLDPLWRRQRREPDADIGLVASNHDDLLVGGFDLVVLVFWVAGR